MVAYRVFCTSEPTAHFWRASTWRLMRQVLLILTLISTLTCGGGGSPIRADADATNADGEALRYCVRDGSDSIDAHCSRDGHNSRRTERGQSVTSDANGVFQFAPLQMSSFTIRAEAVGYVERDRQSRSPATRQSEWSSTLNFRW